MKRNSLFRGRAFNPSRKRGEGSSRELQIAKQNRPPVARWAAMPVQAEA